MNLKNRKTGQVNKFDDRAQAENFIQNVADATDWDTEENVDAEAAAAADAPEGEAKPAKAAKAGK